MHAMRFRSRVGNPPDMEDAGGGGGMSRQTALERLIPLLQGEASTAIADAALARLPPAELELLARTAREEADACRDSVELMIRLIESGLDRGVAYTMVDMLRAGRHVIRLLRNQCRCQELADNAEYYRDHPAVASRIAAAKAGASAVPTAASG